MKRIDLWLGASIALALLVNPDESELFLTLTLWGQVVFALVAKAITYNNEKK